MHFWSYFKYVSELINILPKLFDELPESINALSEFIKYYCCPINSLYNRISYRTAIIDNKQPIESSAFIFSFLPKAYLRLNCIRFGKAMVLRLYPDTPDTNRLHNAL